MENSQISTNDFIGNDTEVSKLIAWLNDWYSGKKQQKYAIIGSKQGNGKTMLTRALSNSFHACLLEITPYDVYSKEDVQEVKQKLNMDTLYHMNANKLILIDDIEDYPKYAKQQFMNDVQKLCKHPIIYTTRQLYKLPDKFKSAAVICQLRKPTPTEMRQILQIVIDKNNINISTELLNTIVKEAPSVRAAINSLYGSTVSIVYKTKLPLWLKLIHAKQGALRQPVDRFLLYTLAGCCTDINKIEYLSNLLAKAEYRFKDIDCFLINKSKVTLPNKPFIARRQEKKLTVDEQLMCKSLHISTSIYNNEYKFLHSTAQQEPITRKKNKKIKPVIDATSLADFY